MSTIHILIPFLCYRFQLLPSLVIDTEYVLIKPVGMLLTYTFQHPETGIINVETSSIELNVMNVVIARSNDELLGLPEVFEVRTNVPTYLLAIGPGKMLERIVKFAISFPNNTFHKIIF